MNPKYVQIFCVVASAVWLLAHNVTNACIFIAAAFIIGALRK